MSAPIPPSWLDANRGDVLKAIENGVTAAIIDYITCTARTFPESIADGVRQAVADNLADHPVSTYDSVVEGVRQAVVEYTESAGAFDDAVAEGTARAAGGAA